MSILPVMFGASWCAPCKATRPHFMRVCAALEPEYVDIEHADSRANDITSVPTIRVYDADDPYGAPLVEHRGAASAAQIAALLAKAVDLL